MDMAGKYTGLGGESKELSQLKYITDEVGSCGGWPRIPCVPLTGEEKAEVRGVLKAIGLWAPACEWDRPAPCAGGR